MILVLLLLLLPCVATAQPALEEIKTGDRVRVSILVPEPGVTGYKSGDRYVGTVLHVRKESLDLEERTIPWSYTSKLELSKGQHGNAGKGAVYGALIGLLAGVVTGATIGRDENAGETGGNLESEFGAGFGLAGLIVGAGVGALVGGASKTDDWHEVLLR